MDGFFFLLLNMREPTNCPATHEARNISAYQICMSYIRLAIIDTGIGAWIDKNHLTENFLYLLLKIPKGIDTMKQIIEIVKIIKNSCSFIVSCYTLIV